MGEGSYARIKGNYPYLIGDDTVKTIKNILIFVILAALLLGVVACKEKQPEFVPPPFDDAAQVGTPTVPEGLGWEELDVNGLYRVSVCGVVTLNGNKSDVYFTNPEGNNVWLKLRVMDEEGNILGQTGLIKPGEYVQSITFDTVPEKGAKIAMKVMGYEPETYYSAGAATLNTVIK